MNNSSICSAGCTTSKLHWSRVSASCQYANMLWPWWLESSHTWWHICTLFGRSQWYLHQKSHLYTWQGDQGPRRWPQAIFEGQLWISACGWGHLAGGCISAGLGDQAGAGQSQWCQACDTCHKGERCCTCQGRRLNKAWILKLTMLISWWINIVEAAWLCCLLNFY